MSMSSVLALALPGFGLGLSLIIAIGAQNAFVLRQGIRRSHVLVVVLICALSDAALIALGVAGMGAVVDRAPLVLTLVRWLGAAFLIGYGVLAARRAWRPGTLAAASGGGGSLASVAATCLAFTWLNPHVYLDTVLLLGSLANTHGPTGRWVFGAGAIVASGVWFTLLGYGARRLSGLFARPMAWRLLDGAIAVTMIGMGIGLLVG
jgi:L-lysine exporter family protein LysE/ArgO